MASVCKQKQSLYFPDEMLREIIREATRLDRSLSWTVQQAWRVAREELGKYPSPADRNDPVRFQVLEPEPARASSEAPRPSPQVLEFLRGKFDSEPAR
jgi:uncharacterized small protein (TIGR04563 family)